MSKDVKLLIGTFIFAICCASIMAYLSRAIFHADWLWTIIVFILSFLYAACKHIVNTDDEDKTKNSGRHYDADDEDDEEERIYKKLNSPFSPYRPASKEFRFVGLTHEGRINYILENKDTIETESIFSREHALDKDKNAISIVHRGKVIGFMRKEYAAIMAPVFDKYKEFISCRIDVWITDSNEVKGLWARFYIRKRTGEAAKGKVELKAALEKCYELARSQIT